MFCIVMDGWATGEWQFVFPMLLTTLIPLNDFMLPMSGKTAISRVDHSPNF